MSTPDKVDPVVLITGAARRIGACMARHIHQAGYRVIIHYQQSADDAKYLAEELNGLRPDSAQLLQADLCDIEQLSALSNAALQCWGRIDALINNASSFYSTPLPEVTESQWNDLLGSNLKGPFFLSQALAGELKNRSGSIVNIADIHGLHPLSKYAIYSIAKAGNIMLTKSLARELAPETRVNGIAPGAILWPENTTASSQQSQKNLLKKIPLGRLGNEIDIAQLALFLITENTYINGQIITVDGGSHLNT